MRVSLVISTYNDVASLRRCLLGVVAQTRMPEQVIVSDDGSTPETLELLRHPDFATLPLEHVWQCDDRWRRPRALNLSLAHCTGEYVVFIDGDCIPRADFVAAHVRHSRPRTFVSGGQSRLPAHVQPHVPDAAILDQRVFSVAYLRGLDPGLDRFRRRLEPGPWEAALNLLTYRYCALRGSNFSAWLADIRRVNGFDENFGYGSDDREFGVRLRNSGVASRWLTYSLAQLHLDHPQGWVDPQAARRQRWKFRRLFLTGTTRVEPGIDTAIDRGLRDDPVPFRHTIVGGRPPDARVTAA
jgi:glycosyltransferase involved in cell wall biosynthesis